jgi:hypothetical protein
MMTMMLPNPVRSNRKQNKNKSSPRRTHTHTRKGQSHYSHRLNQNLNQNQNQDYHQNHYEQEELEVELELELLPDMVESPSGSIETIETFSSGGGERHEREHNYGYNSPPETGSPTAPSSPLYSSSSRMHQRFAAFTLSGSQKNKNQSSQSPRRTSTKKEHHRSKSMENEPSNSSIMMGADIIRRQLSGEQNHSSPTRQASPKSRHSPRTNTTTNNNTNANNNNNKTNKNISPQHALNGVGRTSIDNETWDPFLTEDDAAANNAPTLKNRIIDLHRSPTKNRQHRVQEILSAGDTYFGNKAAAEAKAAELRNRKPKEQTGTGTRSSNLNCMVQRLSEVDDSTFASSSDGNGYMLPNNLLMSGLTCGGLNNTLTCANPQLQLANSSSSSSPSATQPAATEGRINTSIMYQHDEDEFETSTLDFLANLHTKEEDLNFVFGDLENEQVHLCAQSGIPTAQTYFEQFSTRNVSNHNNNNNNNANHNRNEVSSSSYVTAASIPFENMLSSRSSLHQELLKDPAFRHALKAGTLWQSLCSQHVRFPATWWDGLEPVGPPLGSSKKQQQQHGGNHNSTNTSVKPWSYLGRHRVRDDAKLGHLIGNRASSGRILLHLLVRDDVSGDVTEDIACGCYHPNARGVRTTRDFDPTVEDCRDVWIAHRRRVKDRDPRGRHNNHVSTIESLLKHQNKNRVHESPLGAQGGKHSVDNKNMRTIFGSKPPVFTIFCTESELFELFQNKLDGSIPASVVLLRRYLGYNQIS